jgi:16S rRNA (uracil1498-N3)-methyltransferase
MPRFFVRQERVNDGYISIIGEDAHHIARSLRMAVGDQITVCDMQGNEYTCRISAFDENREVSAEILESRHSQNEPKIFIRLFQALPKGDKLDTIIQKAVECGVSEIIPFQSERCVVKVRDGGEAKKIERRRRIALEAAMQSGRGIVPEVHESISFASAIKAAAEADITLFCYEGDGTCSVKECIEAWRAKNPTCTSPTVSVVIGSEGGFSLREAQMAREAGLTPTGLGKRILRTETASGFVLACLVYALELT